MSLKLTEFDPAEYLVEDEAVAAYLGDAFEHEDAEGIVDALNDVVRARGGAAQLASATGIAESVVEKAVNRTEAPDLSAILTVLHGLGVRLTASLVA